MKRVILIVGIFILVLTGIYYGFTQLTDNQNYAFVFPVYSTYSPTSPQIDKSQIIYSAVYLGNGYVLTNWHNVSLTYNLTVANVKLHEQDQLVNYNYQTEKPSSLLSKYICPQPGFKFFTTDDIGDHYYISEILENPNCYPLNNTVNKFVRVNQATYLPIESVMYMNRELDISILKVHNLASSSYPIACITYTPVKNDDQLIVVGHGINSLNARHSPIKVFDDRVRLLLDPDERVKADNKYSVFSTVAQQSDGSIGPGSSGSGVFNVDGKLVGIVWSANVKADGRIASNSFVYFSPTVNWPTAVREMISSLTSTETHKCSQANQ